uniref:Kinesin family member 15 n=1 Tax=Callorhinchus milii TaxID=7868 RepID=A0A4W3I8Z5_CALMI
CIKLCKSRKNKLNNRCLISDSIKVYVRVRPPVKGTALFNDGDQGQCLSVISSNAVRLNSKPEPKIFTYDHVADIHTTQESVFSVVAKGIIESCMNGYNGTIFAYGQTGSGKTFTMLGPSDDSDNFTHNLRGVIPRSFEYLFYLISREKEKAGDGKDFLCKCSFIEIYNEQIYDLLDPASSGLFLRENIKTGVFVEGVIERVVTSAAEAYQVLSMGWRNRSVASTSMNRESSRSHAVFTVTIESKEKISNLFNIRTSQLNLVDLAGSERQRDTRAEGVRLKEASSINRSLSCLGNVIMGLIDVASGKNRHICYRDSKLTFLLRDSLGGNAKTYIIANVHPGSRCFGETLSTLQFARRAKLIKNKATVNEATQGSLGHLQAEIKRLKEQLAEQRTGHISQDTELDPNEWKSRFLEAMLLREKSESEKQGLKEKIGQLKDLCAKKEKILQSNKMIVKFRETNIARLEKLQKESCGGLALDEKDSVIGELREEIQTLKEQIEQDPRVVSYAMENRGLREENKYLRSLESVKRAGDITLHKAAKLEKAFLEASSSEKNAGALHLTPTTIENISTVSQERLKARLLQAQSDMSSVKQEYEEYQELTRKKQMEFESEVQCLLKANQHLENILEATKAHKRQEVSQLNKMHVETIKSLTTPTKAAYNLRSRLVLRMSPDGTPSAYGEANAWSQGGDTMNESLPLDMNEQAYEAIAKELQMVQEQLANTQTKLDEEESQKVKLQQQFDKLEHHSAQINELLSSERTDRNKEQQELVTKTRSLEKELQEMQGQNNLLQSEVHDLRVVLCSADKELILVKDEYSTYKLKQDAEHSQLSDKLVDVHLQLDNIRLEHEKNLEEKRSLQDAYDNLQEVVEFKAHEADQLCAKLLQTKEEAEVLRTEMSVREGKVFKHVDNNKYNNKLHFYTFIYSINPLIFLQEVVTVLMNQTQEMRSLLSEKTEAVSALTQELEEIKMEILSEDLTNTIEQLEQLTEDSKKQTAIVQMMQEEVEKKEAANRELQTQVIKVAKALYSWCMSFRNLISSDLSMTGFFPTSQTPTTPSLRIDLIKIIETQEKELNDQKASQATLEFLLEEMESERRAKNEEILQLKAEKYTKKELAEKLERARNLEAKAFEEKEACRSKLESASEEKERLTGEIEAIRKQVSSLTEENGKLLGHQNIQQKIQYLVKVKKENSRLIEVQYCPKLCFKNLLKNILRLLVSNFSQVQFPGKKLPVI